jgi:putative glutamine amidotransferase
VTNSAATRRSPLVALTATTEIIRGASRVRVNQAYTDALVACGVVPLVVPPIADIGLAARVLDGVVGLVLTGGEDVAPSLFGASPHPATNAPHDPRDACEIALAREARRRGIPTLAICRGIQLVNVAFGGTLIQDIPSELPSALSHDPGGARDQRVHRVCIDRDSALHRIVGAVEIDTNSFHHQALDEVAEGLRVTARTDDGVIEAVESTDPVWWMIGVQWHPEELTHTPEAWDRSLFAAFAEALR